VLHYYPDLDYWAGFGVSGAGAGADFSVSDGAAGPDGELNSHLFAIVPRARTANTAANTTLFIFFSLLKWSEW
jgi:hypothetical protein